MTKDAAVLWTGGKDSALAFHKAKSLGYKIKNIVTFAPTEEKFLAHPVRFIKYQADAMRMPHCIMTITEPFDAAYEKAISSIKDVYGIDVLITGDIAAVDNYPNWISERSENCGVGVLTPLWSVNRYELLQEMLAHKFKIIFSCVKKPWLGPDWLGREIDEDLLEELRAVNLETGLDICGENGEYHTLVLDGPLFEKSISIDDYRCCEKDSMSYLDIRKVTMHRKMGNYRKVSS